MSASRPSSAARAGSWRRCRSRRRWRRASPPTCGAASWRGSSGPASVSRSTSWRRSAKSATCRYARRCASSRARACSRSSPHRGATIRGVDERFVGNFYDVRAALEGMLTGRCAERIGAEGLARAWARAAGEVEASAARGDAAGVVTANRRFHDIVNAAADNPEALRMLERGRVLADALRLRFGYGTGRVEGDRRGARGAGPRRSASAIRLARRDRPAALHAGPRRPAGTH